LLLVYTTTQQFYWFRTTAMYGAVSLALRKRLLLRPCQSKHLLAVRHQQVRSFPWVPFAYRKGASRSVLGASQRSSRPRTRSGQNSEKRKARLRSRRGRSSEFASERDINNDHRAAGSLSFQLESHRESFVDLQRRLEQSLSRYREYLSSSLTSTSSPVGVEAKRTNDTKKQSERRGLESTPHQLTALTRELSNVHVNCSPASWDQIEHSEEMFRQLCRIIDFMILLSTKIQGLASQEISSSQKKGKRDDAALFFHCSLAEQLLLSWIDLRADRFLYVQSATIDDTAYAAHGESKGTLFSWLTNKIMTSAPELDSTETKSNPPMAHEDPLSGPRLEHLKEVSTAVLRTLTEESRDCDQSPFRKMRRAQRLLQLFERLPPYLIPDTYVVQTLMNTFAAVGSYESGRACEKISEKYPEMHDDVFGVLLHAYFVAARSDPRSEERVKAAARAEELVHQRWSSHATPEQYEEKKFVHCTKLMLILHSIGCDAIPDICRRADFLVNMCVGQENLEQVLRNDNLGGLWKIAPANLTLPMLNCLVLVYASSGDPARVILAKKLLLIMLKDDEFKSDTDVAYPNSQTCKSVLAGLVGIDDRNRRWTRVSSRGVGEKSRVPTQQELLKEHLNYGTELLDFMFSRPHCWPDQSYFHSLLRLLLSARPRESGKFADELLSKMQIRECIEISGQSLVTKKTYDFVLRSWLSSAECRDPLAAVRAVEILDMMEAQSLPLLGSRNRKSSSGSQAYTPSVTPDRSTYHLVLKICGAVRIPSEKEDALDRGLSVYRRMKDRGTSPSSDTFSLLFACCALLPENSKRRQQVTKQLLEDARSQGNVNEAEFQRMQADGAERTESDGRAGKKPTGGGGLLSDLT